MTIISMLQILPSYTSYNTKHAGSQFVYKSMLIKARGLGQGLVPERLKMSPLLCVN